MKGNPRTGSVTLAFGKAHIEFFVVIEIHSHTACRINQFTAPEAVNTRQSSIAGYPRYWWYFDIDEGKPTHWLLINGNVKATVFNGRGELVNSAFFSRTPPAVFVRIAVNVFNGNELYVFKLWVNLAALNFA